MMPNPSTFEAVVDIAGLPTRFWATSAARRGAVEAAIAALEPTGAHPELQVSFDDCVPRVDPCGPALVDGDVQAWWDDQLTLAHGGLTATVRGDVAHVGGEQHNPARGFRQLLPYLLTDLLGRHDRFVLHAGAVQRNDRAVLVLGGTGAGKSTTVVAAMADGWRVLSDDLVAVRRTATGVDVAGIPRPMAVPADVAARLGVAAEPIDGDPRQRVLVEAPLSRGWFPLVGTFVSGHASSTYGTNERLNGVDALRWVVYAHLARHERTRLHAYLPVAAAVVRAGVTHLSHGTDVDARCAEIAGFLRTVS